VPLFYADSSALFKLVRRESESDHLRSYIAGADLVSSELVLAEIPRAVRRATYREPEIPLDRFLERAGQVIDALALRPLDGALLALAGALAEPALRALDAIHVATAVNLKPAAFITYDGRQAAAARLAGIRTVAPGR